MAFPSGEGERLVALAVALGPLPVTVEALAVELDRQPDLRPGEIDNEGPRFRRDLDRVVES
ncbi:MAG TPA: hypothetical protein VNM42_07140, partial [Solirubrobacterales bacterium]|nr:hypothetical protein [Solirubrobacterales bacterium]